MNEIKKDQLVCLFKNLPQEKLSSSFREEMMMQIRQEEIRVQKRNRLWSIIGIVSAILCLLGVSVYAIMKINWEEFRIPAVQWTPVSSFYIYFFVLVGVLLLFDYLFRKYYREKHKEGSR